MRRKSFLFLKKKPLFSYELRKKFLVDTIELERTLKKMKKESIKGYTYISFLN